MVAILKHLFHYYIELLEFNIVITNTDTIHNSNPIETNSIEKKCVHSRCVTDRG